MPTTVAVVLAGGRGTRLYPASDAQTPKQFRAFGGDRSLLSETVERARAVADEVYVLTREAYAGRIHDHAPDVAVLTEPAPKDTGPALVYAAHRVRDQVDDAVLLCLPSDHHVEGDYETTFERAAEVARETGGLVTLGVEPTRAATGYGYIEPGDDLGGFHPVETFTEKPDPGAAARYRERGYFWNAGVFAWAPDALLAAARDSQLRPLVEKLDEGAPGEAFASVEATSIDYAVMEDAENAYVVPADFAWDDLGSWDALERVLDSDSDGNAILGDALTVDARDCVVAAGESDHVSVVGVEDLVVATYDGRTLVVPKRDAQRVREVVALLEED